MSALQHGFVAALAFALLVLVAAFFLRDAPLVAHEAEAPEHEAQTDAQQSPIQAELA